MKTVPFAGSAAPAVVLGMMRIAELDDAAIRELVGAAREVGIDFFDHADVYGTEVHQCERRFAEALALTPAQRDEITLQTKAGIVPGEYTVFDYSAQHIVEAVEGSLEALRTDRIDVLLLHRPDALVEPEEVAKAFDQLESSGKVLRFGVSNHTPRQIDLLKTAVTQPLVANQVQYSITHAPLVAQGVAANMQALPQSEVRDGGGLVEYSRINGMTLQAWSPFQAGFFTGVFLDSPDYPELNAALKRLATKYDVTPTGIATAWITRHPARMQVVLGTTNPQRVKDAAAGADVPLTRAEWYELFQTAGYTVP